MQEGTKKHCSTIKTVSFDLWLIAQFELVLNWNCFFWVRLQLSCLLYHWYTKTERIQIKVFAVCVILVSSCDFKAKSMGVETFRANVCVYIKSKTLTHKSFRWHEKKRNTQSPLGIRVVFCMHIAYALDRHSNLHTLWLARRERINDIFQAERTSLSFSMCQIIRKCVEMNVGCLCVCNAIDCLLKYI